MRDATAPPSPPGRLVTRIAQGTRRVSGWLSSRSTAAVAVGLLVCTLAVYLPTAEYDRDDIVSDTMATIVAAHALAHDGTWDVTPYADDVAWQVQVDGQTVTDRFPGTVLYAVPFSRLLGSAGEPRVLPGAVASAFAAAMAVMLMYLVLRRVVDPPVALGGSLVFAFATATWPVSADQPWTHGVGQVWVLAALLALASRRWFLSGIGWALGIVTRPPTAIMPLVVGIAEGWRDRRWRPVVLVGLGSAIGAVAWWTYTRTVIQAGTVSESVVGGYDEFFLVRLVFGSLQRWGWSVLGGLVSPGRGILVQSAFLVVLVLGLRPAWRAAPGWVRSGALAGLAFLLLTLRLNDFDGGLDFFAYRLQLEALTAATPLFALAYTTWVAGHRRRTLAFAVLTAWSAWVMAVGAVVYQPGRGVSVRAALTGQRDRLGFGTDEWSDALAALDPTTFAAVTAPVVLGLLVVWAVTRADDAVPVAATPAGGDDG